MADIEEGSIFSWENPDNKPSWFDNAIKKHNETFDDKNYLISGYWSSDKEGKKIVTKASLGTVIYFHIKTSNIEKNTQIKLKLYEDDGGFSKDDEKFPTVVQNKSNQKKSINDLEIVKSTNLDNRGKAIIELKLEESWASMIKDDFGFEIELYWVAYEKKHFFLGERLYSTLDVAYSKRFLYVNPPIENYCLPEILTSKGLPLIFAIGNALSVKDKAIEALDDSRYFIGARILETGKVITNIDEIYIRKKNIYKYNLYDNSGKEFTLKMASNFGFKNKYVNNGKLVTTKGISQIDYFSNKGVANSIKKGSKSLLELWDINELFDIMYKDDIQGDLPTSFVPTPYGFALDLLMTFVVKPFAQSIVDEIKEGFADDFEIYKQEGWEKCKNFIKSEAGKINNYSFFGVSPKTLQKLLKGDFMKKQDVIDYENNVLLSREGKNIVVFREHKDKYRKNDPVHTIECVFIDNNLLKI